MTPMEPTPPEEPGDGDTSVGHLLFLSVAALGGFWIGTLALATGLGTFVSFLFALAAGLCVGVVEDWIARWWRARQKPTA